MQRTRVERAGDGATQDARPLTRQDLAKLVAVVEELSRRLTRDREDIDMQFQRLAELQAVIDRIQIAARKARHKRDGGAG